MPGSRPGQRPGSGLDARYEHLRHAALHARAEAFPLGLGVLTGKGMIAWRHTLACLVPAAAAISPAGPPPASSTPPLPAGLAAELIHALAAMALPPP